MISHCNGHVKQCNRNQFPAYDIDMSLFSHLFMGLVDLPGFQIDRRPGRNIFGAVGDAVTENFTALLCMYYVLHYDSVFLRLFDILTDLESSSRLAGRISKPVRETHPMRLIREHQLALRARIS